MITIGQLARYVGVSVKTIRVYHDKGLLPEPGRDASGYRRYSAEDVVALGKIRTLAEAGVPLARIRELRSVSEEDFRLALHALDEELATRIRGLQATQVRLRELASGQLPALPDGIGAHLENLARWGFTSRWVDLQRDLWILGLRIGRTASGGSGLRDSRPHPGHGQRRVPGLATTGLADSHPTGRMTPGQKTRPSSDRSGIPRYKCHAGWLSSAGKGRPAPDSA